MGVSRVPVYERMEGGRTQPRPESANTKAAVSMREQDDADLREIIEGFGADKSYELRVYRRAPKHWGKDNVSIEGHLGTFDEWLSEEELEQLYGGGTYCLKVHRPNGNGSMIYFKSVTVKVPGRPKGKGIDEDEDQRDHMIDYGPPPEDTGAVSQAMATLKDLVDTQSRASGMDPATLELIMSPLRMQVEQTQAALREMQAQSAGKDDRIMELITKKPETSGTDRLLDKMFDTQHVRNESIRAAHESEMRIMRENARDDLKRTEDRHAAELRSREEAHRREIDNLQRSMDMQTNASGMGHKAIQHTLELENQRLRDDLTTLKAEVAALRVKKDKTLIEQASELSTLGQQLGSLGIKGFGEEAEEKEHWVEKIANTVIENPEIIQQAGQAFGGGQQPVPQPESAHFGGQAQLQNPQMQPPQHVDDIPLGQPFQVSDGQICVKIPPNGDIVTYEQALKMEEDREGREVAKAAKAAKVAEDKAATDAGLATRPSASQVKMAVTFAENAFNAGAPPEKFAISIRSSVTGNLLNYMEEVGIDSFLDDVASLKPSSPLQTQAGRNYMRDVAKFLLEGKPG